MSDFDSLEKIIDLLNNSYDSKYRKNGNPVKICIKCGEKKHIEMFNTYTARNRGTYRYNICAECLERQKALKGLHIELKETPNNIFDIVVTEDVIKLKMLFIKAKTKLKLLSNDAS